MILYPAIDLKDGQCVRVLRGDLNAATVFNASPADQARTQTCAKLKTTINSTRKKTNTTCSTCWIGRLATIFKPNLKCRQSR